jgi:YVTN family beta-propeller protein
MFDRKKMTFPRLLTLALGIGTGLGLCSTGIATAATGDYIVQQRFALGTANGWDYANIDPVRRRLYLTRGDHVQVLDLPTGKPVGEIANTQRVHGVAIAQDLELGFTSNGATNSVTAFDLLGMVPRVEISLAGANPDAILYDPVSHKVFAFNGKSQTASVIDANTLSVISTIKMSGKPEFAVTDGTGKIYVNIEDHPGIDVIDAGSNTVVARWTLSGCEEPTGLAIDSVQARLFSTCQNKVMAVTDAKTGKRVTDLVIGEHPDAAFFDADTATVFSSNGDGTLTVLHQDDADHYSPVASVATIQGARTMAYDRADAMVYLPAAIDKEFTVLAVGTHPAAPPVPKAEIKIANTKAAAPANHASAAAPIGPAAHSTQPVPPAKRALKKSLPSQEKTPAGASTSSSGSGS